MDKFSFLYHTEFDYKEESQRTKVIKARDINSACRKFLRWAQLIIKWSVKRVDYEVECNGEYIDISHQKGFENLI